MVRDPPEGEQLVNRAIVIGIPQNQVLLTDAPSIMANEAIEVRILMEFNGLQPMILVTLCFHMSRAFSLFNNAGIEVIPYRTDFQSSVNETI